MPRALLVMFVVLGILGTVVLVICLLNGVLTASDEKKTSISKASDKNKDSVKLTLFYESYCPYSIRFIANQLYSTWNELKDHIKLDLVPFGNAKQTYKDGHFVFTCQHGPKECVGNILHACAIDQACGGHGTLQCPTDQLAKAIDYIDCVMSHPDQQAASEKCASWSGLEPKPINKCAKGETGERLESAYGNQTAAFHKPKVTYVPFIVINNKHTEKKQDAARKDLKSAICKYIPDQCA